MAVLTACGGGGDSGSSAPAASPAPATVVSGSPAPAPAAPAPVAATPVAGSPPAAAPTPAPTPAPAPAPAASGGNSCGYSDTYFATGSRAQVELRSYAADGTTVTSNTVNDSTNTGPTSFAGSAVIESVNNLVTTDVSGARAGVPQPGVVRTYFNRDSTDHLSFGAITTVSSSSLTVSLVPPTRRPLNPVLNTTYTSSSTSTTQIPGLPNITQPVTVTYTPLAFETITVPAGTFPVCKYTTSASGATSTEYSIASGTCRGLVIRSLNSSGVLNSEVTSVRVNGAACS